MRTDPEVIGLWAKVEKGIYDALDSQAKPKDDQKADRQTFKPGLDGYHQEFVANLDR